MCIYVYISSWTYTILQQQKRTLNCRICVNKINNNILSLNKRKKTKKKKTIQINVRRENFFLYHGRASTKIYVSRMRSPLNIC